MTSNTDTDDLSIYMGLKYRSMRHTTSGVTIMMIKLIVDTIVTCSLINATNTC